MEAFSGGVPVESRRVEARDMARRADRGEKVSTRKSQSLGRPPHPSESGPRDLYRIVLGCAYAGARGPAAD
jgi:hypothetical protein